MTSATGMVPAIVSVLVLALLVGVIAVLRWRLALTSARSRPWPQPQRDTPRRQANPAFSYGLRGSSPWGLSLCRYNPLNNGVRVATLTNEQRAEAFLRTLLA